MEQPDALQHVGACGGTVHESITGSNQHVRPRLKVQRKSSMPAICTLITHLYTVQYTRV